MNPFLYMPQQITYRLQSETRLCYPIKGTTLNRMSELTVVWKAALSLPYLVLFPSYLNVNLSHIQLYIHHWFLHTSLPVFLQVFLAVFQGICTIDTFNSLTWNERRTQNDKEEILLSVFFFHGCYRLLIKLKPNSTRLTHQNIITCELTFK